MVYVQVTFINYSRVPHWSADDHYGRTINLKILMCSVGIHFVKRRKTVIDLKKNNNNKPFHTMLIFLNHLRGEKKV